MDRMRAYREFVFTLAQAVTIEEAAELDIFVSKALVPTQENARYECDDAELEICSLEPWAHIGTEGIFVSDPEDYAELRNKTTFVVSGKVTTVTMERDHAENLKDVMSNYSVSIVYSLEEAADWIKSQSETDGHLIAVVLPTELLAEDTDYVQLPQKLAKGADLDPYDYNVDYVSEKEMGFDALLISFVKGVYGSP